MNTVSLQKKVSLRKDIILNEVKRNNITAAVARVVFVLDHSGSMIPLYKNGSVQDLLERIFPMAMCFDDNGGIRSESDSVTQRTFRGYQLRSYYQ